MINRITFTGVDERTDIDRLLDISSRHPYIEWGVLVSKSQAGNSNRFPNYEFIKDFASHVTASMIDGNHKANLSLHICGKYVRQLLVGDFSFLNKNEIMPFWYAFQRIQVNTHAEIHQINIPALATILRGWKDKSFIFQFDNQNGESILRQLQEILIINNFPKCGLYDLSHGAGLLPEEWPKPIDGVYCGYAGGLSPENIKEQSLKIESIVGDTSVWIDMETHVRTNDWFDLDKVEACLEAVPITNPYERG